MTPEEMERAIEIVLNNQANFEVQLEKTIRQVEETNQQLGETNRQVAEMSRQVAEMSRQLAETNRHVQEISRQVVDTNRRLGMFADTQAEVIQVVTRNIEAQGEFNSSMRDAVRDLSSTVERYIAEGRNGKA
jgi:chromosome segregation ATPase